MVDRVASLDQAGMAQLFARDGAPDAACSDYIRSFDVLVSYLYDPDGVFRANLDRAGARQVVYGSPLAGEGHMVEHLLAPLAELALFPEGELAPELTMPADVVRAGRAWLDGHGLGAAVAIHPGSGSPGKNWPASHFLELAGRVSARTRAEPFFIVGEADRELAGVLGEAVPRAPLLRNRSLVEVAGVLSCVDAYVGNDSGITHIAGAVGAPVVALFGGHSSATWHPRGRLVRILDAPSGNLDALSVDAVWAVLDRMTGGLHRGRVSPHP